MGTSRSLLKELLIVVAPLVGWLLLLVLVCPTLLWWASVLDIKQPGSWAAIMVTWLFVLVGALTARLTWWYLADETPNAVNKKPSWWRFRK
jgi:hypothetical protein